MILLDMTRIAGSELWFGTGTKPVWRVMTKKI